MGPVDALVTASIHLQNLASRAPESQINRVSPVVGRGQVNDHGYQVIVFPR